jgi:hypothetical protein
MEARITLVYKEAREAKAVSEAISPDNLKTPRNLSVETYAENKTVVTLIKYDGDNMGTFSSTIDDVLSCVAVAEKAFSAISQLDA